MKEVLGIVYGYIGEGVTKSKFINVEATLKKIIERIRWIEGELVTKVTDENFLD